MSNVYYSSRHIEYAVRVVDANNVPVSITDVCADGDDLRFDITLGTSVNTEAEEQMLALLNANSITSLAELEQHLEAAKEPALTERNVQHYVATNWAIK